MRIFSTSVLLSGAILLSAPVFAKDPLRTIADHARMVQSQAQEINLGLKKKTLSEDALKSKLMMTSESIEKLKGAVAQIEASRSDLNALGRDWQLLKDKVQLLAIFHERKSELAGDFNRNRSMIRAHADGIAKRAAMLQETVSRLEKTWAAQTASASSGVSE
ncbi:MAG: hypothetical protein NZV14_03190 [Bryobacteraceae bacterium]|nr:hypothetical protein [Bryobacteraceae bacterium]MDW8377140.1 hypothetical protein [Bryobacterales bacterium]